jgi:hypothetical protein
LNETSNEITDILVQLVESGEFLPIPTERRLKIYQSQNSDRYQTQKIEKNKYEDLPVDEYRDKIQKKSISDFMLEQLYEDAASKNYTELVLIIDKLMKNEPLGNNDRKILANYAFVLNDSPKLAQINLEKAKKRVDQIKRAYGK